MDSYLEVWTSAGSKLVPLGTDDISIGRADTNDVSLAFDPTVSRLHAVIVGYRGGWCLRDVGSANGTSLNGRRVLTEQMLRPDDEIKVGATRIVYRSALADPLASNPTAPAEDSAPELTRRERAVLIALCRPLFGSESFAQPASNQDMAKELTVSEAGVKFHLANLYDKFGIPAAEGTRRARLANEAVRRSAIGRADFGQASHQP